MASYVFDSYQTDNNYLTLYKTTFCGITYGNPRKHVIHRDMINFITYGRYFNGFLGIISIMVCMIGFFFDQNIFYVGSLCIFSYAISQYITSNMVICAGNVYFMSSCFTNQEKLINWYLQQELVHINSENYIV